MAISTLPGHCSLTAINEPRPQGSGAFRAERLIFASASIRGAGSRLKAGCRHDCLPHQEPSWR